MNVQTGATRVDPSDPTIRRRRLDALQRVHRASEILAHEAELAERYGTPTDDSGRAGTGGGGGGEDRTDPARAGSRTAYREDAARLIEIHESLQRERHAARRPFHRRSDRLVLALELAERLALDRLGFDDYAHFEARGTEERPVHDIIDIAYLDLAARELADAEAELAALDGHQPTAGRQAPSRLAPRTSSPVLRDTAPLRPTRTRRLLFDPAPLDAVDDEPAPAGLAEVITLVGSTSAPPLPRRSDPAPRPTGLIDLGGRTAAEGEVIGEIVRDGHSVPITKVPGVSYVDDGTSSGLRPDSISYGDPRRLI